MENSLKGFYEYIQNQGGLRYGHQFMIFLKIDDSLTFHPNIRDLYDINISEELNSEGVFPLYVKSTSVPNLTLTTGDVAFLAAGFKFPGVIKYPNKWNVTVQLDQKLKIYEALLAWKESMSSYALNNGGNKTIPNAIADVQLLDQYNNEMIKRFFIKGIFPEQIQEIDMKYSEGSSEAKTCQVTFTMQYYEEVPIDAANPFIFLAETILDLFKK